MKPEIVAMHEHFLSLLEEYHNSYIKYHRYPSHYGSTDLHSSIYSLARYLKTMKREMKILRKAALEEKREQKRLRNLNTENNQEE